MEIPVWIVYVVIGIGGCFCAMFGIGTIIYMVLSFGAEQDRAISSTQILVDEIKGE
jgi:hypothetical protein